MKLNEEQQEIVASWVAAGDTPSDVQRKLESDMGLKLTFMEVRFLIDDLNLELVEKPAKTQNAAPTETRDANAQLVDDDGVSVSVDPVQRPGAMMSGSVTFSDGESMEWQIDQLGRLGLIPGREGYQPSPDDLQTFQVELQNELRKKGFA